MIIICAKSNFVNVNQKINTTGGENGTLYIKAVTLPDSGNVAVCYCVQLCFDFRTIFKDKPQLLIMCHPYLIHRAVP